jgi:hypothetical protein
LDAIKLDSQLIGKWNNVKNAFASNDIEGGLSYFMESSRDRYQVALTAIAADSATHLPDMFGSVPDIQRVYVWENRVKYRVNRIHDIEGVPVTATYYIYFVKDYDGIWRIEQF